MKTFVVVICSLALASVAGGAQEENKSTRAAPKKKQTQLSQHTAAPGGKLTRNPDTSAIETSANLGQYFKRAPTHAQGSQKVTTAGGRPAASKFHKTQQYSVQVGSSAGGGPQK